jgi:ERCC4-type nuclease
MIEQQEELRKRADALIMSIKESKIKEQRVHLTFLFSSPLLIFFENTQSQANKKSQSLMKINYQKEFKYVYSQF